MRLSEQQFKYLARFNASVEMARAEPGKHNWYRMEAKAEEATVYIYDEIGFWGITADAFVKDLNKLTAKTITLRLNTPGGSVFDGVAIYNALVNHPATINTHIDGLAASMGSIVALAGDKVHMAQNAQYMIHQPWSMVIGDAATMRKEAEVLDKISAGSFVSTYAAKTGLQAEEINTMMDAETWLNADEAKERGFVDEITGKAESAAKHDLSHFARVPDELAGNTNIQDIDHIAPSTEAPATTQNKRKCLELLEL